MGARLSVDLASRYASLNAHRAPAQGDFERPLSFLEAGFFHATRAAVARGVRGFAMLRLGLRVVGPIDVAVLARACDQLVDYHDVMRTTYALRDGSPVALVHASIPSPVRVVDGAGDEARADEVVAEELARDFDLSAQPLHRFLIVPTAPDRFVFVHMAHHIACDGASYMTIFRDLDAIYAALTAGGPAPARHSRRVSYADYAEWQKRSFSESDRQEHAAYWRGLVTSGVQPPPIAALGARRLSQTARRWAATRSTCAPEVGKAVAAFARERKASVASVLLAALLALQHAEGAGGAPVGIVSANRRRETMRIVGMFAALLPLRVPSSGELTFEALLARTEDALAVALDHQELSHVPDPVPEPPFRLVFNFAAKPDGVPMIAGLPAERLFSFEKPRALFDLWLNLELDRDDLLHCRAELAIDLIDDEMRAAYLERYAALVMSATAHPDKSLDALAAELQRR